MVGEASDEIDQIGYIGDDSDWWHVSVREAQRADLVESQVRNHPSNVIGQIKEAMRTHRLSLADARQYGWGLSALERYYELNGYQETVSDNLFHHCLCLLGPPCLACGKPLRTPQAKFCAECGTAKDT